jgi:hypothetical protein
MTQDYPKLRQSLQCPACDSVKLKGCIVCWACYGRFGMRFSNPAAERMLARAEQRVAPNCLSVDRSPAYRHDLLPLAYPALTRSGCQPGRSG